MPFNRSQVISLCIALALFVVVGYIGIRYDDFKAMPDQQMKKIVWALLNCCFVAMAALLAWMYLSIPDGSEDSADEENIRKD